MDARYNCTYTAARLFRISTWFPLSWRSEYCIPEIWWIGRSSAMHWRRYRAANLMYLFTEKVYGHRQFDIMRANLSSFSPCRMKEFMSLRQRIPGADGMSLRASMQEKAGSIPVLSGMRMAGHIWFLLSQKAGLGSRVFWTCARLHRTAYIW